jgi:hypothetical protein
MEWLLSNNIRGAIVSAPMGKSRDRLFIVYMVCSILEGIFTDITENLGYGNELYECIVVSGP